MKGYIKIFFIAILMAVITVIFVNVAKVDARLTFIEDRLNDKPQIVVEEPQRIRGNWQIILYSPGIFPEKIIKTNSYYVKDKAIWFKDEATGEEMPYVGEAIVLPDDGRDLEAYGVYDVDYGL